MITHVAYFDALAELPAPPILPGHVRRYDREKFFRAFGNWHYFMPRTRRGSYVLNVACALWARREARNAIELFAALRLVNALHVTPPFSEEWLCDLAHFVALNYSRGPRRRSKARALCYRVYPFDVRPADDAAEWVM